MLPKCTRRKGVLTCQQHEKMAMFWFERNRCTKKMKSRGISYKHDVKDKLFGSTLIVCHKFKIPLSYGPDL